MTSSRQPSPPKRSTAPHWWPVRSDIPALGVMMLACLAMDALALRYWTSAADGFLMFWPSAGLGLALLLRFGLHLWPALLLASSVAFQMAGLSLPAAVLIATGSTLQALLGNLCLTRFRRASPELGRLRDWTRLILFGACLSPLVGASFGSVGLSLAASHLAIPLPLAWLTWWAGNALGIAVIAPLLLSWLTPKAADAPKSLLRHTVNTVWLGLAFLVCGSLFFNGPLTNDIGNYARGYLLIPLGIGTAISGGRRYANLFVAGLMMIALIGSNGMPSLFGIASPFFDQLHWWLFCVVLTLTTQGIATLLHERTRVVDELLQSRKQVADSEANLLSIAQAPSSLIWMSGLDGNLNWCNDVWLKFTGQSMTEAAGNGWRLCIHPDDRAQTIKRYVDAFAQHQAFQIEFRLRNDRGNYHRMLCNCAPRHTASGQFLGYVGVCIDVTAEREASEQLRSQEQLIRGIYDHSDVGIAVLGNEGQALHHNARIAAMFGWSKDDFNVLGYGAMLHPSERESGLLGMKALLSRQVGHVNIDRRFVRKDGSEFWGQLTSRAMFNDRGEQVGVVCTVIDITTRREAEQRLRLTAKVFEACSEGVMITDAANRIVEVNDAFTAITGYLPDEVLGQTPRILSSGRHPASYYATMWTTLGKEGRWSGEIWNRRRDGTEFPEWLSISVVRDLDGSVTHHVGVFSDITERKQVEAKIRQMAQYDFLTKLPNRALMYDRIRQIHATASRYEKRYAVIFVDLDNFKPINDQMGHDAGDALLCQVADRLKSNLRVADTAARYGGDEFVVLVPEIGDENEVRVIAEKLSSALRQPYLIKQQVVSVTPSIGVALYPDHALDPDDLIRVADKAMYEVKARGRDGLAFYAPGPSLPN